MPSPFTSAPPATELAKLLLAAAPITLKPALPEVKLARSMSAKPEVRPKMT
jgi:hypothetical protein